MLFLSLGGSRSGHGSCPATVVVKRMYPYVPKVGTVTAVPNRERPVTTALPLILLSLAVAGGLLVTDTHDFQRWHRLQCPPGTEHWADEAATQNFVREENFFLDIRHILILFHQGDPDTSFME
jgi:hypothetical protein